MEKYLIQTLVAVTAENQRRNVHQTSSLTMPHAAAFV